jgi:hypothetical protein
VRRNLFREQFDMDDVKIVETMILNMTIPQQFTQL